MEKEKIFEFKRFRQFDWLTIAYLFIWIALIIVFYQRIPSAYIFLLLHLGGLIITVLLAGILPRFYPLRLLRDWYPMFYIPLLFTALHYLLPAIHPGGFDLIFIKADLLLTGTYPTVWIERFYYPLLTDIMQISYSTFYFLPLLILIPSYFFRNSRTYNNFMVLFLLAFYLSYLGYLAFPALGPRFYLAHLHQTPLRGSWVYHILSTTLNSLENVQWDAFPSGHVTIALVVSYFAFKHYRMIFYWSLPVVFLLILSTLYLQYHYLVDVLAGILLYFLVIYIYNVIVKE